MAAFTEAHELKARWRDIDRQQASAYQVRLLSSNVLTGR
jgi:hypothetical protein